jgi:hypothetical protein
VHFLQVRTANISVGTHIYLWEGSGEIGFALWNSTICAHYEGSHSIVNILTGLQAGHPRNHSFIPGLGMRCISWPKNIQTDSGTLPTILFSAYCGLFPVWVKHLRHEPDDSPPSSADVKNEWSYISTTAYSFISCTRATLPLLYPFSLLWHGSMMYLTRFFPNS